VLLDADYTARLGDFGYSSLVGNIPEALTYLQRSTARPGALRWIAPEQVDPEEKFSRTTKTDIYSFGCVALQESSLESDTWPMLISLQALSGKQPWSEVQEDLAVVLRLAKGRQPGRPESRTLNDSHWHLIQRCWSRMEERPVAEAIIPTIQQFLSHCPQCPPLCDSFRSWSGQANLGAESSSSLTPTEGSSTHHGVTQAARDEDDQNRYIVMIISVQSIMLTLPQLHLAG
jgi:serine/threonine protein kinase